MSTRPQVCVSVAASVREGSRTQPPLLHPYSCPCEDPSRSRSTGHDAIKYWPGNLGLLTGCNKYEVSVAVAKMEDVDQSTSVADCGQGRTSITTDAGRAETSAVCCVASAVSWATWLLFTGVLARCVVLRVRCPGPLGSRSQVRPLGVLCCVCGVPGHLAPVHRCACSMCCFACAASWATWLLFTGVPARCVVLRVRCPGSLGSCSPVCPLGVLCCVYGVLGHLSPVHRCARSVCCFACAVSWATWLLFTSVLAQCVVLRVRCPGPHGSCSPLRLLGVL